MIKEIFYENETGQKKSLLAQEKTVELLFNNRYADYLKYRLQNECVRLIKTKKYVRPRTMLHSPETIKASAKHISEEEMKMMQAEQRITKKKALEVMIKYTDKKTRTR